jgi:hypothetical protein
MLGKAEMHVLVPILEKSAPYLADWYTVSTTQPPQRHSELLLKGLQLLLIAPLFEEVVFRGMIFQRWAYSWRKPLWALIASSILFSAVHGHILSSFVFAATATILYLYTRSLWAPIIMHMVLNGASLVGANPVEVVFVALSVSSTWAMGVVSAATSFVTLFVFFWWFGDSLQSTLPYIRNEAREARSTVRDENEASLNM